MFLPWRDHSFFFDEDDIGMKRHELNFWVTVYVIGCISSQPQHVIKPHCYGSTCPVSALWDAINNPVESVTGAQFRETGEETFTQETLLFDAISPADEIPNHLLLLYLNLGTFLFVTGLIFAFNKFDVVILCIVMMVMGSLNIIFQVNWKLYPITYILYLLDYWVWEEWGHDLRGQWHGGPD